MKLTNYIIDLGRAIAYYPGLRKVTGSTNASIFLCQLLYWTPKAKDRGGWIYKDHMEIEEETGLTRWEQDTAKKALKDLGLIEYEFKRLDHTSGYRVIQENLNARWEQEVGEKSEPVEHEEPEQNELAKQMLEEQAKRLAEAKDAPKETHQKKGDIIDLQLALPEMPGAIKMRKQNHIRERIEKKLHVNTDNKKWTEFIDFAYNMQELNGEDIEKFLTWALDNGFSPIYWTPEKMKTLWPTAFIKDTSHEVTSDFVQKLPELKEEELAPMPKGMGRKKELF